MTIESEEQKLDFGQIIQLFTLDMTDINGPVFYFTPNTDLTYVNGGLVKFNDIVYTPIDIQIEGFEITGKGQLPQPTLRVANVNRTLGAAAVAYDDLVGAKLTRLRTLAKYLDDGAEPDPTAYWTPDIYRVAQKAVQNRLFIEFKLEAWLDLEGNQLPARKVYRNYCGRNYRIPNPDVPGAFIYSQGSFEAECPYAGTRYFTETGEETGYYKLDVCGKKVTDCKLRFGNNPLPTWAFPGAGKNR